MNTAKVMHVKFGMLNSSRQSLEVWLEWEVLERYAIAPGQPFVVHALTRDLSITKREEPDWDIFLDATNNCVSVYMPGDLTLAEDFYLTDGKTFDRLKPTN
jgi:hypothetical protein